MDTIRNKKEKEERFYVTNKNILFSLLNCIPLILHFLWFREKKTIHKKINKNIWKDTMTLTLEKYNNKDLIVEEEEWYMIKQNKDSIAKVEWKAMILMMFSNEKYIKKGRFFKEMIKGLKKDKKELEIEEILQNNIRYRIHVERLFEILLETSIIFDKHFYSEKIVNKFNVENNKIYDPEYTLFLFIHFEKLLFSYVKEKKLVHFQSYYFKKNQLNIFNPLIFNTKEKHIFKYLPNYELNKLNKNHLFMLFNIEINKKMMEIEKKKLLSIKKNKRNNREGYLPWNLIKDGIEPTEKEIKMMINLKVIKKGEEEKLRKKPILIGKRKVKITKEEERNMLENKGYKEFLPNVYTLFFTIKLIILLDNEDILDHFHEWIEDIENIHSLPLIFIKSYKECNGVTIDSSISIIKKKQSSNNTKKNTLWLNQFFIYETYNMNTKNILKTKNKNMIETMIAIKLIKKINVWKERVESMYEEKNKYIEKIKIELEKKYMRDINFMNKIISINKERVQKIKGKRKREEEEEEKKIIVTRERNIMFIKWE